MSIENDTQISVTKYYPYFLQMKEIQYWCNQCYTRINMVNQVSQKEFQK